MRKPLPPQRERGEEQPPPHKRKDETGSATTTTKEGERRRSWIVHFRKEVCSKAKNPTLALQWIKEIEAAKSLDNLITPKSTTGKDFPDYAELDLMRSAALKRCYDKQTNFRKKLSVEEQRAQKDNRFSQCETNCLFGLRILSSYWIL